MGEILAVLSGKGGTGKTSICAAVAEALADSGETVLCIDCDVGLRNLDLALALEHGGAISFQDVCSGGYSLSQALQHPDFPTLRFLTAPAGCSASQVDTAAFGSMLQQARQYFRYILLDAPAGVEQGFRLAAFRADRIVLVTVSDPAAIRDAAETASILEGMGKSQIRLVVNRVGKRLYQKMNITIDGVMDAASLPLLGIVPEDANVTLAAAAHKPLLRHSRRGASAACRRIAARIQGKSVPITLA